MTGKKNHANHSISGVESAADIWVVLSGHIASGYAAANVGALRSVVLGQGVFVQ